MINLLKRHQNTGCEMQPFTKVPAYYDRLMQEVDYREWCDYLQQIFRRTGVPPGAVLLDMACGTGTLTLLLSAAGYKADGFDSSEQMLKVARAKARAAGVEMRLWRDDLRSFTVKKPYRAITCLFDSINYLRQDAELQQCCGLAYKALDPGGVFAFDLNTVYSLSVFWHQRVQVHQDDGIYSIWRNRFDPATGCAELQLTLFVPEKGLFRKVEEMHRERGYELDEIRQALERSGFKKIEIFRHGTFEPPVRETTRVMVVAEKV